MSCWGFTALAGLPKDGDWGAVVDFHLERGLRLHTKPEHKNLYSWAINEIDAQGQQIGDDQIPWGWTLSSLQRRACLVTASTSSAVPDRGNHAGDARDRAAPAHSGTTASGQPARR